MKHSISTIILIYNEYENLEIIIEKIKKIELSGHKFVIFDNGSTDLRIKNLLSNLPKSKKYEVVSCKNNKGFGGGVIHAAKLCETNYVGWIPGNLRVDIGDVEELILNLRLHPNIFIKAKRVGRKKIATLKTFFFGLCQSVSVLTNLFDTGGTPTYVHSDFFKNTLLAPKDISFESYCLYRAKKDGLEILRPRIKYGVRIHGKSTWQFGFISEILLTYHSIKLLRKIRSSYIQHQ